MVPARPARRRRDLDSREREPREELKRAEVSAPRLGEPLPGNLHVEVLRAGQAKRGGQIDGRLRWATRADYDEDDHEA